MNLKRCFILGSGPSIKNQDLRLLRDEYTFCSNWFLNHEYFDELNINYYCSYDDAFVTPGVNQEWVEKLNKYPKIQKYFPKTWAGKVHFENQKFVPYDPACKVYETKKFHANLEKPLYDGGTVIINMCIPIAIATGFKEIILLGCDTTYFTSAQLNPYFYDIKEHKTYFNDAEERNKMWQKNVLQSYEVIQDIIREKGVIIKDATSSGTIQCFEKVSYESVVKEWNVY